VFLDFTQNTRSFQYLTYLWKTLKIEKTSEMWPPFGKRYFLCKNLLPSQMYPRIRAKWRSCFKIVKDFLSNLTQNESALASKSLTISYVIWHKVVFLLFPKPNAQNDLCSVFLKNARFRKKWSFWFLTFVLFFWKTRNIGKSGNFGFWPLFCFSEKQNKGQKHMQRVFQKYVKYLN